MGLFGSIGRWFKALGYLLTGRIDSAREALDTNPHVVLAKYDDIIRDKVTRIQEYKKAVASLVAQEEKKVQQVQQLTDEVQKLENLKTGAAAKAKKVVADLQSAGKSQAEIHADEEYKRCLAAFNDFTSTLAEKQARISELEASIEEYRGTVGNHKVQLQSLLREVEGLKSESVEMVADVITAREEKEISDMLSGIATDGTSAELQRMRDLRGKIKAESRISREIAGVDTRAQEAEFLNYARTTGASNEFDALIGLSSEAETASPESATQEPDKLPE
jgi:chromosome segregation ATPase